MGEMIPDVLASDSPLNIRDIEVMGERDKLAVAVVPVGWISLQYAVRCR